MSNPAVDPTPRTLPADALDVLVTLLRDEGYDVRGPVERDETITCAPITSTADLAVGRALETGPGMVRVVPAGEPDRVFASTVGADSARQSLLPHRQRLFAADRTDGGWRLTHDEDDPTPTALLGVRACDLAAIAVQDRVFLDNVAPDPAYAARRQTLLLVAVGCASSSATCFCASTGDGPAIRPDAGADLVLTEVVDDDGHRFVATAPTDRGRAVLDRLPAGATSAEDATEPQRQAARAAAQQTRRMRPDAPDILRAAIEDPHWDDVAERCLSCANCTLVCPTCFCTAVEDTGDLLGEHTERWRRWDSCFTTAFTHTPAGPVRASASSRYRQWLTHKLTTWIDQFGTSGCVGCGRCIAWCPVGIDLTREVDVFAAPSDTAGAGS